MQLILTPQDIILRCLWDRYRKYCISKLSDSEVEKIIEENKPRIISEEDGYVIGLLKIIETDNLIHAFNEYIIDILQFKSSVINNELYINKKVIIKEINNFTNNFPASFKAPFNYKVAIDDLIKHIGRIETTVGQLEEFNCKTNDKIVIYVNSKHIRKCLS